MGRLDAMRGDPSQPVANAREQHGIRMPAINEHIGGIRETTAHNGPGVCGA